MMLSQRVSQPLVGLARLVEEWEEVGGAMAQAGDVLNRPLEVDAASGGLRPKFAGAVSFEDVTFTYAGTKTPALDRVSFAVPAGTMLGLVGRSGSGKSTITRLLQGINREYSGFVKIDGADLREINLRHLRSSFGVVLQENFLFRGSIRDNILAGRPGLTLEDAIRAARLAGAEEFIERMPNGYETYIEEGSPNLSGGQQQRLAIARALITDPRILILDEATSALDPESEALVNANLPASRAAAPWSSSPTGCRHWSIATRSWCWTRGKVMDIAPHATLLERCTVYRQLWDQQNRHMINKVPAMPRLPQTSSTAISTGRRPADPTLPVILEYQSPSTAIVNSRCRASRVASVGPSAAWYPVLHRDGVIQVDKVVTAQGMVVARRRRLSCSRWKPRLFARSRCNEGDTVHAGQILARLDPTFAAADLEALTAQVAAIRRPCNACRRKWITVRSPTAGSDPHLALEAAIYAQRKSEYNFKMENYRQKADSLSAQVAKSRSDVVGYKDRLTSR